MRARAIGPICDTRNEYLFDSRLIQTDSRSSRSVRRVVGVKSTLLREAINSFTAGMSLFDISCGTTVRKKEAIAIAAERAGAGADKAGGGERAAAQEVVTAASRPVIWAKRLTVTTLLT